MRTTAKQVTNVLQSHILEHFGMDYGWDTNDQLNNLTEQIISMKHSHESDYQTAYRLVEGGTFLIYYADIKDFLNGLDINSNNKDYDDVDSWTLYCHLLAREIAKLVRGQKCKNKN